MRHTYTFDNITINCAGCVPSVEAEINEYKTRLKITQCSMDYASKTLSVEVEQAHDDIYQALLAILTENERLAKLPVPASPKLPPPRTITVSPLPVKKQVEIIQKPSYHGLQALFGILTGTVLMLLMIMGLVPSNWMHNAIIISSCLATVVLGKASLSEAFADLTKRQKFSMDTLFSLSSLAAIACSLAHIFFPVMPMLIDIGLMIFGFRHAGQWIETQYSPKIYERIKFTDRARHQDYSDGTKLDDIQPNTILKLLPGSVIPLNGILLDNFAELDASLVNGEETTLYKKNAVLLAGMVVKDQPIHIQVTAKSANSYLQKLDNAHNFAQKNDNQASSQHQADKILQWFIPFVMTAAVIVGLSTGYFLGIALGIKAALYLAVCACPCALGMINPMAMQIGLDKLEKKGVHFSQAKGLESAAKIDKCFFDLIGTMTEGKPVVVSQTHFSDLHLALIRGMEYSDKMVKGQTQYHPIAQGILDTLGSGINIIGKVTPKTRQGIEMEYQGKIYKLGNAGFTGIDPTTVDHTTGLAQQHIYFTEDGVYKGHFTLQDTLRDDAKFVLQNLVANGIEIEILTGSNEATAQAFATALEISPTLFKTDCSPELKEQLIQDYQKEGKKSAFFGDSGNDHGAIRAASLGIAVISPHTDVMCKQDGAATLANASLLPVLDILAVGRETMHHVKQSLNISFTYNLLAMAFVPCAIFLFPALLNPAFGLAFMAVQSTCLFANALCIKNQTASLPVGPPIKTPVITASSPPSSLSDYTAAAISANQWMVHAYPGAVLGDYLGSVEQAYTSQNSQKPF